MQLQFQSNTPALPPPSVTFSTRKHRSMTSSIFCFATTLLAAGTFASVAATTEAFALFKSNDRGRSWTRSDAGIPGRSRINAFGSADGVLFAGTDSGIFVTRDQALSWQPSAGAAMSAGRILSFATSGRRVFAGTDGNGLLASLDGGASWRREPAFRSQKVRCLLAHDGKVYAGTEADGATLRAGIEAEMIIVA